MPRLEPTYNEIGEAHGCEYSVESLKKLEGVDVEGNGGKREFKLGKLKISSDSLLAPRSVWPSR